MEANKHQGTDVIQLQANATYTLTRVGDDDKAKKGDLDVSKSMQLVGNGATIYVRARACNANGCTHSPWSSFTIKP